MKKILNFAEIRNVELLILKEEYSSITQKMNL